MLKTILLIALMASNSAYSYSSNFSASKSEKKIPVDFEMVFTTEQTKSYESYTLDGLYNQADISTVYSATEKDDFRVYASSIYQTFFNTDSDIQSKDGEFSWDLAEIMYRRNNIANNYADWNIDLELKNYFMLDSVRRERYGFDGAFVPQIIMKKSYAHRYIIEIKLRHHFYHNNNNNDGTLRHENRVYITPTYAFSRKLFVSTEFKYRNKERKDNYTDHRTNTIQPQKTDHGFLKPSISYVANNKLLLSAYIQSEILKSGEKRGYNKTWKKGAIAGISAYMTIY